MTIDWFRVTTDLQRCGVSIRQQAIRAGVDRTVLHRARIYGSDLYHGGAVRLLALWGKTTGRDAATAPTLLQSEPAPRVPSGGIQTQERARAETDCDPRRSAE